MSPLQSFLRAAGIVTALLGVSLTLFPEPIVTFFGNGEAPNTVHFVRFLGTSLIGFGVLNWMSSMIQETYEQVAPTLYGNFASLVIATFVDLVSLSRGVLNQRSWAILLLHVGFGVGFGYCIIQGRRLKTSHGV